MDGYHQSANYWPSLFCQPAIYFVMIPLTLLLMTTMRTSVNG